MGIIRCHIWCYPKLLWQQVTRKHVCCGWNGRYLSYPDICVCHVMSWVHLSAFGFYIVIVDKPVHIFNMKFLFHNKRKYDNKQVLKDWDGLFHPPETMSFYRIVIIFSSIFRCFILVCYHISWCRKISDTGLLFSKSAL